MASRIRARPPRSAASRATTWSRSTRRGSAPTTRFSPSSATFRHEEAFAGAERAFGNWSKAPNTAAKPQDPPAPTRRVVVIDRPGAVQTEIRVGNIGLPRRHPDYLALDLAINILGGEGGNRLHRVLRSDRGLTYGASADLNAYKESGNIVADTDTRSDSTGEALRLIVDEFWRLQRQRVRERRARRRPGLSHRQLPADDRDAERDRAADPERRVLRPRSQRPPDLSRAGQRDYAGRHPARGAAVPASRPAVDRPGRRCVGVHEAAGRRRVRSVRAHSRSPTSISGQPT